MTDETIVAELARRRAERSQEVRGVENLRTLLARVDARRKATGQDRARWDDRADALEQALAEGRLRVSRLDREIRELENCLADADRFATAPRPKTATMPQPASTEQHVQKAGYEAARRILGVPVFELKDIPLEDFALAKVYSESSGMPELPLGQQDELKRRIGIYDRRRERERMDRQGPLRSSEERRRQIVLRQTLDKCRRERLDHLTLGEIDLLIHAHDLVVQGRTQPADADRLAEVLSRAIDEVCERWMRLRDLRDRL